MAPTQRPQSMNAQMLLMQHMRASGMGPAVTSNDRIQAMQTRSHRQSMSAPPARNREDEDDSRPLSTLLPTVSFQLPDHDVNEDSRPLSMLLPSPAAMTMTGQSAQKDHEDSRPLSMLLLEPYMEKALGRNEKSPREDTRPLSMLMQPGILMPNSPASNRVSVQRAGREILRPQSMSMFPGDASIEGANRAPVQARRVVGKSGRPVSMAPPKRRSIGNALVSETTLPQNESVQLASPKKMQDAILEFEEAKKEAEQRHKHNLSAKQRLINNVADLSVVLLTRAMHEGATEAVELRVYRKPVRLPDGNYAVAEYKDASKKPKDPKKVFETGAKKASVIDQEREAEYTVITLGELMPEDAERDCLENWISFSGVPKSFSKWTRFCWAMHKRIGWKLDVRRSKFRNIFDLKYLGFVTIKFANLAQ